MKHLFNIKLFFIKLFTYIQNRILLINYNKNLLKISNVDSIKLYDYLICWVKLYRYQYSDYNLFKDINTSLTIYNKLIEIYKQNNVINDLISIDIAQNIINEFKKYIINNIESFNIVRITYIGGTMTDIVEDDMHKCEKCIRLFNELYKYKLNLHPYYTEVKKQENEK